MASVKNKTENRLVLQKMNGREEMARSQYIIAESNILEVLREQVSQAVSRLADVPRGAERTRDAIYDVRSASKRVIDKLGTMMDA